MGLFGRVQHKERGGSRSYYWAVGWLREQRLQLKDWLYWLRRGAKHSELARGRRR